MHKYLNHNYYYPGKAEWNPITITGVDVLPKAGAGQWGTDELVNTYKNDTPGQNITKFKDYKRTK